MTRYILTDGIEEGIRCAMCTNHMKSDRGCDGSCVVDERMYKKVIDTIHNHMFRDTSIPTEDVRPVVRGKWEMTNDYVTTAYGTLDYCRCSCCGEDSLEEGDFCPNCGADMREVEE